MIRPCNLFDSIIIVKLNECKICAFPQYSTFFIPLLIYLPYVKVVLLSDILYRLICPS